MPALLFIKAAAELIINYGQNTDTFHNVLDDTGIFREQRFL